LAPAINRHQSPSCFGPIRLLQQHTETKHLSRECCGGRAPPGTGTPGFAPNPARSIQGDELKEEERNLEERGGRVEDAKPACLFSWHIPLGAGAAWLVAWQEPQVSSPPSLTLMPIGPLRPVIPCK